MIRCGFLLAVAGSMGLYAGTTAATTHQEKQAGDGLVLTLQRSGGFVPPDKFPLAHYQFTVAKDGSWELKPAKGEVKKGKLAADDVTKWLKAIDDGGFDKLKSNPSLGAADEPFMDITVQGKDKKQQKRIPLQEKLAQTLEKKVLELAGPGK